MGAASISVSGDARGRGGDAEGPEGPAEAAASQRDLVPCVQDYGWDLRPAAPPAPGEALESEDSPGPGPSGGLPRPRWHVLRAARPPPRPRQHPQVRRGLSSGPEHPGSWDQRHPCTQSPGSLRDGDRFTAGGLRQLTEPSRGWELGQLHTGGQSCAQMLKPDEDQRAEREIPGRALQSGSGRDQKGSVEEAAFPQSSHRPARGHTSG